MPHMQRYAEKMTEEIIKKVEGDPSVGPLLLRLNDKDKREIYSILETAGRLMCGESEVNITENVTNNLRKLIKEWCVTKEYLEQREDHYMEVLERSNNKQAKKLEEVIVSVVKNVVDEVDGHKRKIDEHHRDIESLKYNDRRQDARLEKIEHQNVNMAIKLDNVDAHTKQIPQLFDLITSMHDTINISLSSKSAQAEKPKPKQSFFDKLPIQAWLAIAAGISGAIVYILTGEIINFGGA